MARYSARKDRLSARVDRPKQQAQQRNSDSIANDIGNQPCHQLKSHGAECESDHVVELANSGRSVSKNEPSERDAGPETSSDISNLRRISVSIVDQVGDDPTRDCDFCSLFNVSEVVARNGRSYLIRKDEQSPEDGDLVLQRELQLFRLGLRLILPASSDLESRKQRSRRILLVVLERPPRKHNAAESDCEQDKVESRPENA